MAWILLPRGLSEQSSSPPSSCMILPFSPEHFLTQKVLGSVYYWIGLTDRRTEDHWRSDRWHSISIVQAVRESCLCLQVLSQALSADRAALETLSPCAVHIQESVSIVCDPHCSGSAVSLCGIILIRLYV